VQLGAMASSSAQMKRTACHLCCKRQDYYDYIITLLPVKESAVVTTKSVSGVQ